MAKKIAIGLSAKEFREAAKQICRYQNDLNRKCEELCRRLTVEGIQIAQAHIGESPLGKTITLRSEITPEKVGCKAILLAVGKTVETEGYAPFNTLLAVEFGSGIFFNANGNPKAVELGFGVGTFPNQKHAFEDGWFYPSDEKDEKGNIVWKYTHGVKATMPMYYVGKEIREKLISIARDVFKS